MVLPTVSVITPTYNHEKYIGQCIESVLEQTFTNWEMIIIDDGSTDNTQKIVSKYRDARIKYIYQENIGPYRLGETYNKALSLSEGNLIAILEGDDFWPPDKLEKQIPAFADPDIVLSHGNYELVYFKNGDFSYKPGYIRQVSSILNNDPVGNALYGLVDGIVPIAVTIIIRKSALVKVGGFKYADFLPFVDLPTELELSLTGKFKYIPTILGYFRRHKSSITHNLRKDNRNLNRFKYVDNFLHLNKERIAQLGISIDELEKQMKESVRIRLFGGNYIINGKELLELGDAKASREAFKKVLSLKNPASYKMLACLGIVSTYLGINLCEYATQLYWKLSFNSH